MQEADRAAVCILVDKWDKIPRLVLQQELEGVLAAHSPARVTHLLDTLDVRDLAG